VRDEQVQRLAMALLDQLRSGRRATFIAPAHLQRRVLDRLHALMRGSELEETPD
jgi:hypothetical protein